MRKMLLLLLLLVISCGSLPKKQVTKKQAIDKTDAEAWEVKYKDTRELYIWMFKDAGKSGVLVKYERRLGPSQLIGATDGALIIVSEGDNKIPMECYTFKSKKEWAAFDLRMLAIGDLMKDSGVFDSLSMKILVFANAKCTIVQFKRKRQQESNENEKNLANPIQKIHKGSLRETTWILGDTLSTR